VGSLRNQPRSSCPTYLLARSEPFRRSQRQHHGQRPFTGPHSRMRLQLYFTRAAGRFLLLLLSPRGPVQLLDSPAFPVPSQRFAAVAFPPLPLAVGQQLQLSPKLSTRPAWPAVHSFRFSFCNALAQTPWPAADFFTRVRACHLLCGDAPAIGRTSALPRLGNPDPRKTDSSRISVSRCSASPPVRLLLAHTTRAPDPRPPSPQPQLETLTPLSKSLETTDSARQALPFPHSPPCPGPASER